MHRKIYILQINPFPFKNDPLKMTDAVKPGSLYSTCMNYSALLQAHTHFG